MKKLLAILAAAAAMCACNRTPSLVILHVNDTHSHNEPERSGLNAGHGGVIERAAFLDSVRLANGESRVMLLHAGDFSQGSSYFTRYDGELEIDVINAMRYDCVALGNHEFDNGIEALAGRLERLSCPVVCANLDLSTFEVGKFISPCTIVEKGDYKVGVIGLAPDITTCVAKDISSRIPQLDPVVETNRWAALLKEQGCYPIILLSHQGYAEDQANAALIRNVDLVIGGHSHTVVDGFIYVRDADGKEIPIITDGCHGLEMGEIKLY